MITIDPKTCTRCNRCVRVCTKRIIQDGPSVDPEKAPSCIQCGHCFAVCPAKAITLSKLSTAGAGEIQGSPVALEGIMDLLKRRRSVRAYKPQPVSREHLEKIIEAASNAPSAKNSRLLKAYVYTDPERIRQIAQGTAAFYQGLHRLMCRPGFSLVWRWKGYPADKYEAYKNDFRNLGISRDGKDPVFHDAPAVLVFTASRKDEMAVADGWIAAQNAVLCAEALGVATCYNGYLVIAAGKNRNLKSLMKIPQGEYIISALTLGYPDVTFKRYAPRQMMETIFA